MSENPYQAPTSRLEVAEKPNRSLAGRGARFGAYFLDGLLLAAIVLPIEFATGMFASMMDMARYGQQLPYMTLFGWNLLAALLFVLVQGYPLVTAGQTWGKRMLSIRIVSMDGSKPTIGQLAIRYGIYFIRYIPYWGTLPWIVEVCFVFREDRRCGHDLAAGTQVVER